MARRHHGFRHGGSYVGLAGGDYNRAGSNRSDFAAIDFSVSILDRKAMMTKSLIDSPDSSTTITSSTGTPAGSIGKTDFDKIFTGLLMAVTGAAIVYFSTEVIPDLQSSGDVVKLGLAAMLAVVVNIGRKFLTDTRAKE